MMGSKPCKTSLRSVSLLTALLLVVLSPMAGRAEGIRAAVFPAGLYPGDVARIEVTASVEITEGYLDWQQQRVPLVRMENGLPGLLSGIPRDLPAGRHDVLLKLFLQDGSRRLQNLALDVGAKVFPEQHLTLPPQMVRPDPEILQRHSRERAELERAFARGRQQRLWSAPFQRPVPGKVLSPFGVQRILNGEPRSYHSGVDLRAARGEPIVAAGDGQVLLVADHYFAGKSVYIDHGMGIITMYFHLDTIAVQEGEQVSSGQTLGLAGATGRATGPHLHWGARIHQVRVDPLALLRVLPTDQSR